jgi:hypothetical protein
MRRNKGSRPSAHSGPQRTATKHLLETSLLYPLKLGSLTFRERVNAELAQGRCYTTAFVRMEFRRRVLVRIAEFCIQLKLPSVRSADDLLAAWSNHFGGGDAKLAIVLCRQLIPAGIDTTSPTTKDSVFQCLVHYALQLESELSRGATALADQGHRCQRAVPSLLTTATHPDDILTALVDFVQGQGDTTFCRANCKIDTFLERNQGLMDRWISEVDCIRGRAGTHMKRMVPDAQDALAKGLTGWTCRDCEKLGDWIITLDCPDYLQLEHLDHVYDYLCPTRNLSHRRHTPDRLPES